MERKELFDKLLSCGHMLIGGVAGSGKTTLLQEMAREIQRRYPMEEAMVIVMETRGADWEEFKDIYHLPCTNREEMLYALRLLMAFTDLAQERVRNGPGTYKPRMYFLVDEFAPFMKEHKELLEEIVMQLGPIGREKGVNLVLATQSVYPAVLTGVLRANIPSRAAFRLPREQESMLLLDAPGAETLEKPGDMLFYPIGAEEPVLTHVPLTEKA